MYYSMRPFGDIATVQRTGIILVGVVVAVWLWAQGNFASVQPYVKSDVPSFIVAAPPTVSQAPSSPKSLSDFLFPVPAHADNAPWTDSNHQKLKALFKCIEHSDCTANQTKIIMLSSHQFRFDLFGDNGGEKIWARSTVRALKNMGYTYIYTSSIEQMIQMYQIFPDLIKIIIADDHDTFDCHEDTEHCSQSNRNPAGIPSWKMFSFNFWAHDGNPHGPKWNLAPEDYHAVGLGDNTYLGYSIEDACHKQPFIPHSEREKEGYILAKLLSFFTEDRERAWSSKLFDAATNVTGIKYIIGAINDTMSGEWPVPDLPSNHVDFGMLPQPIFLDKLSRTRVLIGMGNPATSPTPYDALCLGVPFINPILNWDRENPTDRSRWYTQHNPLSKFDPPYVYNVFKDDLDGFVNAVKEAIANPIESFVPDHMHIASIERRLGEIIEKDWQTEAALRES